MTRQQIIGRWIDKDTYEAPPWLAVPLGMLIWLVLGLLWLTWLIGGIVLTVGLVWIVLRTIVQSLL